MRAAAVRPMLGPFPPEAFHPMRTTLLAAALLSATLAACQGDMSPAPAAEKTSPAAAAATQADAAFAAISKRWLEGWLPLNPAASN